MLLVEMNGEFLQPSSADTERRQDWFRAEDVAHQMRAYCIRKLAEGAVPDQSAALERGLRGLRGKSWFDDAQNIWIMKRTASLLGWPPLTAQLGPRRTYETDITEEQAIAMGIVLVGPPRPYTPISSVERMLHKLRQQTPKAR